LLPISETNVPGSVVVLKVALFVAAAMEVRIFRVFCRIEVEIVSRP
jgi:hypothetical protein